MKKYDNNIAMFDAYLNNLMSADDKQALEQRLAQDSDLRQELQMHKELVYCLQKTCGEANRELGEALKGISDEEFRQIASVKRTESAQIEEEKSIGRVVPLKKVYRWMSIAAMVFIIAGVGVHQYQQRQSRNQAFEAIYATGFNPDNLLDASRQDGEMTPAKNDLNNAIKQMDIDPETAAQELEVLFASTAADAQNIQTDCGIALAYAYVKTHDIEKAKETIQKVRQLNDGLLPEELENLQRALNNL